MIICFVRHGEDMSDIYNEVGGWSDRGLTPRGIKTAFDLAERIDNMKGKYGRWEIVLTSPFARAKETATIISKELSIRLEEDLYLKERNTYGLMSGVSKDVMKNEYPELYEIYIRAGDMPGAEKYEDFVIRIKRLMAKLPKMKDQNIVCVAHGHLMTVMINEVFGEKRFLVNNGGGFVVEFEKNKWKMIEKWGISKYSGKYWK